MKSFFKSSYFAIVLFFMYVPIVVMVMFSFNSGDSLNQFDGWSYKWYEELFNNSPFIKSILTSLFVAITSTIISIVIGVLATVGLWKVKPRTRNTWFNIANVPLINADVVTAVSLMIVFLLAGMKFGIWTLIAAHISFNVPYVIITIMPFLKKIDKNIVDASQDLGSTPTQTFWKVIIPILLPSIISACAICFAMSFDDFIISYFTGGDQTNVSTFIYTAKKMRPYINAFGTLLLACILFVIISWNIYKFFKSSWHTMKEQIKNGDYKIGQINYLQKEIDFIQWQLDNNSKIRKTKNISLWIKYFAIKIKLKNLAHKNYNSKISKLEWKREKYLDEIKYEKRVFVNLPKALEKNNLLKQQLETTVDKNKIKRIKKTISNLDNKISKLEKEKVWIIERREEDKERIIQLIDIINELQTEFNAEKNLSIKDKQWYKTRINKLTKERDGLKEGRNKYKLNRTIEKLANIQSKTNDNIRSLAKEVEVLKNKVYSVASLTEALDNKIINSKNDELKQKRDLLLESKRNSLILKASNIQSSIDKIKSETERKRKIFFPILSGENPKHKNWFQRSWKGIFLGTTVVVAFSTLTTAYVLNNTYDLVVGNWGDYIDFDLITQFEKEEGVKINYQQYDSNETLYNKIRTIGYDVMVPSDYMAERLIKENKVEKIYWDKLNISYNKESKTKYHYVDKIKNILDQNEPDNNIHSDTFDIKNLSDYFLPYFWGDVRIAFNMQRQSVKDFVKKEGLAMNPDTGEMYFVDPKYKDNPGPSHALKNKISWQILWDAAKKDSGLNDVFLNSDPKNIFTLALEKLYGVITPQNQEQFDAAKNELKPLIKSDHVGLLGDELIDKVADGLFDVTFMYNGDLLSGMLRSKDPIVQGTPYKYGWAIPDKTISETVHESTNVWTDGMVVSKNSNHKDLAYKFMNFIVEHSADLSKYSGYTSPVDESIEELKQDVNGETSKFKEFSALYDPNTTGQRYYYNPEFDDKLVDAFNKLIILKH